MPPAQPMVAEIGFDCDMTAAAVTRAHAVDRFVAHDAAEPRTQAASARIGCECVERAHVTFLQHVFRFTRVAHDAHCQSIQPLVVATHDPREGILIALRGPARKCRVVAGCGDDVGCRHCGCVLNGFAHENLSGNCFAIPPASASAIV